MKKNELETGMIIQTTHNRYGDVNDNCSPLGNSFLTVNDFSKMFEDKKFRDYNITIVGIDGKISVTSEVY